MTQIDTIPATCDAYDYFRADGDSLNQQAVCTRLDGHPDAHHDRATGHTWSSSRWTRAINTARYKIEVHERFDAMFEPYEMDPDHYDADEEKIARYEEERGRMVRILDVPLGRFADATRVNIGGKGLDEMTGMTPPYGGTDEEWAAYNAAELEAMAKVFADIAPMLAARGTTVSGDSADYMPSHYAYCLMCSCSPGMVFRNIVRPPNGGKPVDISVEVRSDADAIDRVSVPTVITVERIDIPAKAIEA